MASTNLQSKRGGYSAEMDEAERASRDQIAALQTKRLAWTLAHAYDNVAHYKKAFDKAGVHPGDFKQLSDLAKFPFTVKTDLRDNYPFNMFAVPREKLVRIHASSGTTGKPIVVGYTRADIDTWSDVMARSIRAAGGRTGMIMHNAYGYGLFTGGIGAHYGAEKLGCTVVPVSGGMTARPGMRRMEKVTGRSDDMIILRGVNVFPTQIEEALLATDWCGGHFIIELTREGRMDEMTVHAEARPEYWDGSGLHAHAEKVAIFIKNTIGITARIKAVAPDTLERSL